MADETDSQEVVSQKVLNGLQWLNTVFDTSVLFTFFSKTLDILVTKNGSKEGNNKNIGFSLRMCRFLEKVNKYNQAFEIGFVYLQTNWSLDFLYNFHTTSL